MTSFNSIGAAGSSSLGVVAPGIAEALIATAAGLFAAIPAVYFYNHFTSRVKQFSEGDGRLLARVPEHLRAELYVTVDGRESAVVCNVRWSGGQGCEGLATRD